MQVFLNGRFLSEERARISVFDRGFLYGDGLFEAILITRGHSFLWEPHLARFFEGVRTLKIPLPYSPDQLRDIADKLITRNRCPETILRMTLSRGAGERGYSPSEAVKPTFAISLHPAAVPKTPEMKQWRVIISRYRLPANDPLSRFKTASKIHQVMARLEADEAGADDALLLNTDGHLTESTTANLFWVKNNIIHTPPLSSGALPGVTRSLVLELCQKQKIPTRETAAGVRILQQCKGIFLTMTSKGIVQVASLDGKRVPQSSLVRDLFTAYREELSRRVA